MMVANSFEDSFVMATRPCAIWSITWVKVWLVAPGGPYSRSISP